MNYQELQEAKQTFRLHALEKDLKPLFKAREDFVRRFNPKKIASMTIDEYGPDGKTSINYQTFEGEIQGFKRIYRAAF